MPKNKISITGGPGSYAVLLNDNEITRALRRITFDTGDPGPDLPNATLHLAIWDWGIEGEANIVIPEATRELLITLGWTPPAVAK